MKCGDLTIIQVSPWLQSASSSQKWPSVTREKATFEIIAEFLPENWEVYDTLSFWVKSQKILAFRYTLFFWTPVFTWLLMSGHVHINNSSNFCYPNKIFILQPLLSNTNYVDITKQTRSPCTDSYYTTEALRINVFRETLLWKGTKDTYMTK